VSNTPLAGHAPENTVPPPGPVTTHVNATPGSASLIVTVTDVEFVNTGGADTDGAGGAVVSRVQVTVVDDELPAASVAVTTNV
jgi:hypothetical protein